jgi:hypothetical protein
MKMSEEEILSRLYTAIEQGALAEVVRPMLQKIENRNRNIWHTTQGPLVCAVWNNRFDLVQMTVDEFDFNVDAWTTHGTPLFQALMQGNTKMAKFLVEKMKANVNIRYLIDRFCVSTLTELIRNRHFDGVQYLLHELGADVNLLLCGNNGSIITAIFRAIESDHQR